MNVLAILAIILTPRRVALVRHRVLSVKTNLGSAFVLVPLPLLGLYIWYPGPTGITATKFLPPVLRWYALGMIVGVSQ